MDKKIDKIMQTINSNDNGGEQIVLITEFFDNGDRPAQIFTNQQIILQSYGNSASINLCSAQLNSNVLFRLAKEMLVQEIKVEKMIENNEE